MQSNFVNPFKNLASRDSESSIEQTPKFLSIKNSAKDASSQGSKVKPGMSAAAHEYSEKKQLFSFYESKQKKTNREDD